MLPEDWVRLEAAARSHFLQLSPRRINAFARWGNGLLDAVSSRPNLFENPEFVEDIFRQLIDFMLGMSEELPPSRPVSSRAARQVGLSKALDYLRDRLDGRISVADLCRVAGVSERTLQYAFGDEFGISPTEFMRRRRLHAVRQKLMTSSAEDSSVSQIAFEHGFYELDRFAAEYRRLFGVYPSNSLRS
jgi:AraC family ethanolamine operon transcriptional activator